MEGIGFIILLIAIVYSITHAKKLDKNRPGQGQQARKPGVPTAAPRVPPVPPVQAAPTAPASPVAPTAAQPGPVRLDQLKELLQELIDEAPEQEQPAPAAPSPAILDEGESFLDDKDCVGGSLPHDETALHEGESGMYTEKRSAAAPETQNAPALLAGRRIDAAELRRAVVMSEILGKPKALQRRRAS